MIRYLPLAALALAACSAPDSSAPPPAATDQAAGPQSDTDKTLYALGVALGSNIREFSLTADELTLVVDGLRDGALNNTLKVEMQTYGPRIQLLAQERASAANEAEKLAAEAWLAEQAAQPGAEQVRRNTATCSAAPEKHRPGRRNDYQMPVLGVGCVGLDALTTSGGFGPGATGRASPRISGRRRRSDWRSHWRA